MTSQIIPTNPTAGSATTSSVRENFRIADEEITQLQRSNIDAQDLTGGSISYSVTYPADPAFALVDGVRIAVRVNVTNSSTVTDLNVNGTGGVPIKSVDGKSLSIGDLVANQYYELMLNSVVPESPYWACLNISKNVINVQGPALGSTTGDEVTQAEFTSFNANKSKLLIKDERWDDGNEWTSASKVIQFQVDSSLHSYIASSTEGSGLRGIEIGTHDGTGAREKFFVGDADGGAYLFHDNVKKLQTTSDGILLTGGDAQTPAQPSIVLRSEEDGSTDNQLGEIVFQGKNDAGDNHTYAYMRAESPSSVDDEEKGKIEYFIRKPGNQFHNALNITSVGIDLPGVINADSINLNGNNPLDGETVNTGDVLCKRIRFDDQTDNYNDLYQIYAEKNASNGDVGHLVLEAKDNADDKIIFRMGNYPHDPVDVLTASATSIRVPADKRLQFGTESSGYLEMFEATNGNGYIKQVGDGDLIIQGENGYLQSDSKDVASWGSLDIALKYNGSNRIKTGNLGVYITGNTEGLAFRHDVTQVGSFDGSWNSFGRNGGSNVLYVQQGRNDTEIASFRRDDSNTGNTAAAAGVEVVGIKHDGIRAMNYFSSDGSTGISGTANSNATLTIKNGLIVAAS